jgi:hypothetical protein
MMSNSRELYATVAERAIDLRKDGAEALRRKRTPKGEPLTRASQLVSGERYRTPMSDLGHRWDEGIFFRCGRYVEYPLYYEEGWDHLFGPHWVLPDPRKQQKCAVCYDAVKERNAKRAVEENIKSANKLGVVPKWPEEDKQTRVIPRTYTQWVDEDWIRRNMA